MLPILLIAEPRFGGWFQPWVVAVMFGVPALLLITYRAKDLRRWVQNKAWRRRANQDWTER